MSKRQEIIKLINTGKYTDKEISILVGTTHNVVNNYRHQINAPVKSKWGKYVHLLGIKSDKEIAKIIGITPNAVTRKRIRMGMLSAAEHQHQKMISAYMDTLVNPQKEVETTLGGRIDILTENAIYECKVILNRQSTLEAVGQLFIYSLEYPFHKKIILTSKIDCPKHIIKSLKILNISVFVLKI